MKSIVAGLDFSDRSREALAEALRLARLREGMVHAVHIVERAALDELHTTAEQPREQLEGKVLLDTKRLIEASIAEAGLKPEPGAMTVEVTVGTPSEAIIGYAAEVGADGIVLARNSTSDPSRGAGSTAVQVVRHAPIDVLLVREGHAGAYRRVAACIDLSEHSHQALECAAAVAGRDDAELHLVHAYQPFWDVIHLGAIPLDVTSELQEEQRQLLKLRIGKLAQKVQERFGGREPKWHVIPAGSAATALIEFLAEQKMDLAVVASHGRTGLRRILLGSVAERIIRDALCSVFMRKIHSEDEAADDRG